MIERVYDVVFAAKEMERVSQIVPKQTAISRMDFHSARGGIMMQLNGKFTLPFLTGTTTSFGKHNGSMQFLARLGREIVDITAEQVYNGLFNHGGVEKKMLHAEMKSKLTSISVKAARSLDYLIGVLAKINANEPKQTNIVFNIQLEGATKLNKHATTAEFAEGLASAFQKADIHGASTKKGVHWSFSLIDLQHSHTEGALAKEYAYLHNEPIFHKLWKEKLLFFVGHPLQLAKPSLLKEFDYVIKELEIGEEEIKEKGGVELPLVFDSKPDTQNWNVNDWIKHYVHDIEVLTRKRADGGRQLFSIAVGEWERYGGRISFPAVHATFPPTLGTNQTRFVGMDDIFMKRMRIAFWSRYIKDGHYTEEQKEEDLRLWDESLERFVECDEVATAEKLARIRADFEKNNVFAVNRDDTKKWEFPGRWIFSWLGILS